MSSSPSKPSLPPYILVKTIALFRSFLLRLNRALFPGNVVLYEQFQSLWVLPSLYVAAELDVAEHLRGGSLMADEIAKRCNADPGSLYRVLRALSSEGIFKHNKNGSFELNSRAKALLNGPGSLKHMIIQHLGDVNWIALGSLLHTVRTGEPAFKHVHGSDMYEYLAKHPDSYDLFDKSMSDLSGLGLAPLLSAYSFRNYKTIADIGGGEGFLLSNIIALNPGTSGVLFDMPEVLSNAGQMLMNYGVEDKIIPYPGNFLESVPVVADLYLLKNIIHNWDEPDATRILKNIECSMPPGAKVLIMEMIIPEGPAQDISKLLDIQMMASFQEGKERTRTEFKKIIEESGLMLNRIIPTIAPVSIIEVVKKQGA